MEQEILEKVQNYLKENYSQGDKTISLEQDYEFPIDAIEKIVNAKDLDSIYQAVSEEEDRIYFLNAFNEKDEIFEEVSNFLDDEEVEYSDFEDEIREEIEAYNDEMGVIEVENVLQGQIRANVYPHNKKGERLSFSEFSNLENINLGADSYGGSEENLLLAMELLRVNPYEVGKLLLERGDIIINNFPKQEYDFGLDPKQFLEEVEENGHYGGDLMFTTSMDLNDYVENFETIKERGILIPENTQFGFIDSYNGTCSFVGFKTPKDIELKEYDISDDRAIEYGLDKITGVTPSYFWGSSKLNFVKTQEEKDLLGKATLLGMDYDLKKTHSNQDDTVKIVSYFVDDLKKDLDNKPFSDEFLNPNVIKEKFEKFYWLKDKPEILNNAMKIISNIAENFKEKSADELLHFVDEYRYGLEDFKSPIQKQIVGIKEHVKRFDFFLEEKFARILEVDDKYKVESAINGNFKSFKEQFNGLMYDIALKQDKRFSSTEQEKYFEFIDKITTLIDSSKETALKELENGTFDARKTATIITKIADAVKENESLLNDMQDKKGLNEPSEDNTNKSKPRRDR